MFVQYPTKALAPLMLEDYRKVMVDRRGEEEQFTYDHIMECMKKGVLIFFDAVRTLKTHRFHMCISCLVVLT